MAQTKGGSQQDGHETSEEQHQRRGVFSKVKDKLDFTKHLGFQSAPDSLVNRQFLENAREREAREAEEECNSEPAAELGPDDGIGGVAKAFAGAVTPQTEGNVVTEERKEQGKQKIPSEPIQFHQSPPRSKNPSSSEEHVEAKEQGKEKSEESKAGWGRWMAHKLHQVSRAAASKDLSDDLLKPETKTTKDSR